MYAMDRRIRFYAHEGVILVDSIRAVKQRGA